MSSLENEVCQLKAVLQEEQQKTGQLSMTMQMEIDQTRALVQVKKPLFSDPGFPKLGFEKVIH